MASIVCLWGTVTVLHCLIKSRESCYASVVVGSDADALHSWSILGVACSSRHLRGRSMSHIACRECLFADLDRHAGIPRLLLRHFAMVPSDGATEAKRRLVHRIDDCRRGWRIDRVRCRRSPRYTWVPAVAVALHHRGMCCAFSACTVRLTLPQGVVTIAVGVAGFLLCPDLPGNCSWRIFSPEEMRYLSLRVKYKDGPIPPSPRFDSGTILEAFKDWKTYIHASLLALGGSIPTYSVNYTLASMVKAMGYTAITAQALTAPPYFFAIFFVLFAAWFSDKFQTRTGCLLMCYTVGMM